MTASERQATALIHEGWNHLQSQRPLAAWGTWQRALRIDPESAAARQAISALESAGDLPLAARTSYRFREPDDPARRAVWDERMRGQNEHDLEVTADLFGRLAAADPADSSAWYNRALCLAWSGKNQESIACLDRVVGLDAERKFDRAARAWVLADVLRQGGGAESLADDLRFACTIAWKSTDTAWLLAEFPEIQKVPSLSSPGIVREDHLEIEVFEWLDRPAADLTDRRQNAGSLPTVLAIVYIGRQTLRLSSTRVDGLERIEEALFPRLEDGVGSARREASPLPLPFLDADVWTVRIPSGTDPELADRLRRESVEQYFENQWIHRPRRGLDNCSPLAAALRARPGDAVARAKLTAVIRLREQLGSRASALLLYQGYPFDRLRRRLGLELETDDSVDPQDLACASAEELDSLESSNLDDSLLLEAFASAAGLRDDARTARLAAELLARRPETLMSLELTSVVAPLVRRAMECDDFNVALNWLEQARAMSVGPSATTLDVWRAEVLARAGRPQLALVVYERLITPDAHGAALALDAAETVLDNGHTEQAKALSKMAAELARGAGRRWIERRAQQLLDQIC
jgi:tetratricopeptide (TPR) repeat protein